MAAEEKRATRSRKILMITNVDRGEANVFLATAHALLQADANVEIHLATFAGLEKDVASVWEEARLITPQAKPITYHKIQGLSMKEGLTASFAKTQTSRDMARSFIQPPSITNTPQAIRDSAAIFIPYTGPELLEIFNSIVEIIKDVAADLVVVDSLMTAALTACFHLGIKWTTLSPNAIKDFAAALQPGHSSLWKFPALFSGYTYPVPWYRIPFNIYFVLVLVKAYLYGPDKKEVEDYLADKGVTLRTPLSLLKDLPQNHKILVSSLPELDFPLIVPSHILPCGPIVRHVQPISEADPSLDKWLARGPTVYVNLGSLLSVPEDMALELAKALKVAIKRFDKEYNQGKDKLQVLWKLKKWGEYKVLESGTEFAKVFEEELQDDRVRIVNWIHAEPISVLRSENVICSVHHGGANSYNEAVLAGVPQVILPPWTDCYDYAQRVELLGIGRWGSRNAKPGWTAAELSSQLVEVLLGKDSVSIRDKAKHLARVCTKLGNGADIAARYLLKECETP